MRARLVVPLLLVTLASLPALPAHADGNPASRDWVLRFTLTGTRTVGQKVERDSRSTGSGCASSCESAYQTFGTGDSAPVIFLHAVDPSCGTPPCDMHVAPERAGTGFAGTIHWDGTTYVARGAGVFDGGSVSCQALLPPERDSMTFTVDGDTLTGTASILYAWVADTPNGGGAQGCNKILGYEIDDGTITGHPNGGTAVSGTGGGTPLNYGTGPYGLRNLRHDRPSLSVGVASAKELPWRPSRVAVSAFLALLLVVLMPFPAALFNSTLEENYEEVRGWFSWVPRRPPDAPPRPVWQAFAACVLGAAVLNAFLDPGIGIDRASVIEVAGLALSIAAVSVLASVPARVARGESVRLRVFPLGLVVALVCVVVSRLTSFEPGYLYGVIAGFAVADEVRLEEKGRLAFVTAAFLLLASALAFAARVPVHSRARGGAVAWVLLDTVLAAVFAAGVEANVLGLLPLRFLHGEAVMRWKRPAWAVAFGLSLFAFLHALAGVEHSTSSSVTVAAVLFVAFGTVSVAFWAYFRFRRTNPTPVSV
jgi:hypothetical protein